MIRISMALRGFRQNLLRQEASENTVSKYMRDVRLLAKLEGEIVLTPWSNCYTSNKRCNKEDMQLAASIPCFRQ